jgi:Raf kinase inhibitor-like YbhB/YbcL family protein
MGDMWGKCLLLLMVILGLLVPQEVLLGQGAFEISSPAFKHKGGIPDKYAKGSFSIPLSWKNVPQGTKSFALSIVDIHPVAQNWVHWMVINIPPQVTSLEEGVSRKKMPSGAIELKNSWGEIGYGGPEPPPGSGEHSYVITIYALNVEKLDLKPNTSLSKFEKTMKGKVLGSASITGMYSR